jgi:hypothetical protein
MMYIECHGSGSHDTVRCVDASSSKQP